MGLFDTPTSPAKFAKQMIDKFGETESWYLEYEEEVGISNNPTDKPKTLLVSVPIAIAIVAWEISLIDNTTILNGDRKCYIAYSDDIKDKVKAGNYLVKKDINGNKLEELKIVTPVTNLSFKGAIASYVVNVRN